MVFFFLPTKISPGKIPSNEKHYFNTQKERRSNAFVTPPLSIFLSYLFFFWINIFISRSTNTKATAKASGLHSGAVTHHHDQAMTPVRRKTRNTTKSKGSSSVPTRGNDDEDLLIVCVYKKRYSFTSGIPSGLLGASIVLM